MSEDSSDAQSWWLRFFSHPVVGIIGTAASVISIPLGVYFYLASRAEPKLTVFLNPVRTSIVKRSDVSSLAVLFRGRAVPSDITAVQVAFWNDGNLPIRRADVLTPLTLRVRAPILEATIRKRSRDVTAINVDTAQLSAGVVQISWAILERNDGAVIQLIYAGSTDTPIESSATVVGQHKLQRLEIPTINRFDTRRTRERALRLLGYVTLSLAGLAGAFGVLFFFSADEFNRGRFVRYSIIVIAYVAMGAFALYLSGPAGPPFGF